MATATAAAYEYRAGIELPLYALKRRKTQKQPGFRANSTYGHCTKDKVLIKPACGDGNFLAEIPRLKFAVVRSKYRKNRMDMNFTGHFFCKHIMACIYLMMMYWIVEVRSNMKGTTLVKENLVKSIEAIAETMRLESE